MLDGTAPGRPTPDRALSPLPDPPRQLLDLCSDILHEILHRLGPEELAHARLTCRALAKAGATPRLSGWEGLLNGALRLAPTADRVVAILARAADRGVLDHLTHLNLSHRGLGNGHLAQIYGILAAIPSNQVTHLNLSHNGLGAASAHPLPAAPSLPSLLYLDFHGNALGEVATPLLARALAFTSVQELNLADNGLDASSMPALTSNATLGSLRRLNLDGNDLGEAGARALATAPDLAALSHVSLRYNNIGCGGAQAMQGALPRITAIL